MNDTPRTDAAIKIIDVAFDSYDGLASSPGMYVEPDFARELERENNELRKDKERLDWLCTDVGSGWAFINTFPKNITRDDIDAAIEGKQ